MARRGLRAPCQGAPDGRCRAAFFVGSGVPGEDTIVWMWGQDMAGDGELPTCARYGA